MAENVRLASAAVRHRVDSPTPRAEERREAGLAAGADRGATLRSADPVPPPAPADVPSESPDSPMPDFPPRPLVLGHRGAPAQAPENTMAAFRLALEQGADGVELDVQPAADGVPVVIHDDTLDRTTDSSGIVAALPWERIARARSRGEPVPRLEEVAEWAAETGAWLNVELKRAGAEAASLEVIEGAGLLERTVFSSFFPAVVAEVGRLEPRAARYFLTERWDDPVRHVVRGLGAHGVCLKHPLATPPVLAELRAAGLPAVVWTVDRPARIRELLGAGVRALITNHPARGAAILREVVPSPNP
jgi:glycerophosphoryl diester phosphodiesterase